MFLQNYTIGDEMFDVGTLLCRPLQFQVTICMVSIWRREEKAEDVAVEDWGTRAFQTYTRWEVETEDVSRGFLP